MTTATDNFDDPDFIPSRTASPTPTLSAIGSHLSSDPEIIDLLSDTSSIYFSDDGVDVDRKPSLSPAPSAGSASSFEILATVRGGSPSHFATLLTATEPEKPKPKPFTPRRPRAASTTRVPLSEIEQAQIVSLRTAGWSFMRIAEHLQRPLPTVYGFHARRQAKIDRMVATLPGSSVLKAEDVKQILATPSVAKGKWKGKGVKRERHERSPAPELNWVDKDVKNVRVKKDEPM